MPTDTFEVAYSGNPISATHGLANASDFCDWLRDRLIEAGWEQAGAFPAETEEFWPLIGWVEPPPPPPPGQDPPPKRPITWRYWHRLASMWPGVIIAMYDPFRDDPEEEAGVVWAQWGLTSEESLANLAGAISGATPFTVEVLPNLGTKVTAKEPGTKWNDYWHWNAPYFGTTGQIKHGGWRMRSKLNGPSQYDLWLQEDHCVDLRSWEAGSLKITPTKAGAAESEYGYWVAHHTSLRLIANPYQCALISKTGAPWFLSSAPKIVPESGITEETWFAIGRSNAPYGSPGHDQNLPAQLCWHIAHYQVLDGQTAEYVVGHPFCWSGLIALRYPTYQGEMGQNLLTNTNRPIVQNAYLLLCKDDTDTGGVVGKLWDAMILSQYFSVGSQISYDGCMWVCILEQDPRRSYLGWPGGSVFLAITQPGEEEE